jgi:hypothetical protein
MTYLGLINRFWKLDREWGFSGNETRLFFLLLDLANSQKWEGRVRLDTGLLMSRLGVSDKQAVRNARSRLKAAGLVDFISRPGRGNRTEYLIGQCAEPLETAEKREGKRVGKRVGKTVGKTAILPTDKPAIFDKRVGLSGENPTLLHHIYDNKIIDNIENNYYDSVVEKGGGNFTPGTSADVIEVEEAVAQLSREQWWLEIICKNHRLERDEVLGGLDAFRLHCRGIGEERKSLSRFKFHFDNWLRKQRTQQTPTRTNETIREDRFSRRRGVDPSSLRPEDYT